MPTTMMLELSPRWVRAKAVPPTDTTRSASCTHTAEQVRHQVIPFDLCSRDTEPRSDRHQFIGTHHYSPNRSCSRVNVIRIF